MTSREVVIGLSQFLSEHARSNYNEQESINKASGVVWTWPEWKGWLLRKFNPEEKIMRKMQEYRSCIQGRHDVDQYYAEFLELCNYCASKGSDVEQKVQFLAGPQSRVEVGGA